MTVVCPSSIHVGAPVRAVAPGQFTNPWNHALDGGVVYCAHCAYWLGERSHFFTPAVHAGYDGEDFTPVRRPDTVPPEVVVDVHGRQVLAAGYNRYVPCEGGCGYVIGVGDGVGTAWHLSCRESPAHVNRARVIPRP
jgi:hypothetical protein